MLKLCLSALVASFVFRLVEPSACYCEPSQLPGWKVVWSDDFDGDRIDTAKWRVITSTKPTNNSLHAYLPGQVSVAAGNLVITSLNHAFGKLPYRSGQVISKSEQQYGRWEVRAKLPTSRGMWPAIWLLPDIDKYLWPSQGEIDIMENRGDEPNMISSAFHWGTNPPYFHSFVTSNHESISNGARQNYHESFHTYAVEWEPAQIRFFVDGQHHYTVNDANTNGDLSKLSAGMHVVLNIAVGGDFLNDPDATTVWPQQMLIDYVYVYSPATDDHR